VCSLGDDVSFFFFFGPIIKEFDLNPFDMTLPHTFLGLYPPHSDRRLLFLFLGLILLSKTIFDCDLPALFPPSFEDFFFLAIVRLMTNFHRSFFFYSSSEEWFF